MQVVAVQDVSARDQNGGVQLRTGSIDTQRLFEDDAPDGLNFWICRNTFANSSDAAFKTPRHHHPFAQIKLVEKGSSNYLPGKNIQEGDIAYFPRAAWYGPQEKDNCTSFGIQFGFNGQHQRGRRWEEKRGEAMERLKQRGKVEGGIFFETDPATGETLERDSIEALYDERLQLLEGRQLVVEPEGYDAPILMHPKNFPYFKVAEGVDLKHLGRFYDQPGPNGDVAISMVRLSDGGTYTLGADRAQIGWTMDKTISIDGELHSGMTGFYSRRGETAQLSGDDGVEIYLVTFPRLD